MELTIFVLLYFNYEMSVIENTSLVVKCLSVVYFCLFKCRYF